MTTLHLGVVDLPYTRVGGGTVTTGDVAGFLENRYHIMEIFVEQHASDIVAPALEVSLAGAITNLMAGAPPTNDPFGQASSKIEDGLKQFIATGEMERLGYPGVPTQASLDRASGKKRSGRFKRRRATGKSVSFVDTGLYVSSAKAWFTP